MIRVKYIFCFFLILPYLVNAQEENQINEATTEREVLVDDFINIKVYSGIEVKLIPSDENRVDTLQWLMWQMSSVGPIFGQAHHFLYYNPGKSEYSELRFKKITNKIYKILNNQLDKYKFVSGGKKGNYTIADMAIWPWIARHKRHQVNLNDYPSVYRWYKEIYSRPAVQKGYHVPHFEEEIPL